MMKERIQKQLVKIKQQNLFRNIQYKEQSTAPTIRINKIDYLDFTSNDYLGLSQNPAVIQAGTDAIYRYGASSNASSWVTGLCSIHQELKNNICEWTQMPACCLFSSGFLANIGTINALVKRHDYVYHDKKNHASLIDAITLSQSKDYRYKHLDYAMLEKLINLQQPEFSWIVSDAVFSMSGEIANLNTLANIANNNQSSLIIDDAHGVGVLGSRFSGAAEQINACHMVRIIPFGKAIGTMGAAVVSDQYTVDLIEQSARSFGFSTSMPPSIAASSLASISLIRNQSDLHKKLHENISYIKNNTSKILINDTSIARIYTRCPKKALDLFNALKHQNILTQPVRHPSVSLDDTGLRIIITAKHSTQDLNRLIEAVNENIA